MDIRILSTKNRIQNGLVKALAKQSLYQIKDKDIITEAQVSPSSYYKYYSDKSGVIRELEDELLAEFRQALAADAQEWRKAKKSPSKKDISRLISNNINNLINFFKNKKEPVMALNSDNGDIHFKYAMINITTEVAKRLIIYYFHLYNQQTKLDEMKLSIVANHYALAILGPLFFWLRNYDNMAINGVQKLIADTMLYSPYDLSTHHLEQ